MLIDEIKEELGVTKSIMGMIEEITVEDLRKAKAELRAEIKVLEWVKAEMEKEISEIVDELEHKVDLVEKRKDIDIRYIRGNTDGLLYARHLILNDEMPKTTEEKNGRVNSL